MKSVSIALLCASVFLAVTGVYFAFPRAEEKFSERMADLFLASQGALINSGNPQWAPRQREHESDFRRKAVELRHARWMKMALLFGGSGVLFLGGLILLRR